MMVAAGDADGMVAGVTRASGAVIRAAVLTVGLRRDISRPSSFFIMDVPPRGEKQGRTLLFADCGVSVSPDASELARIGVAAARNARALLGLEPRVAFLSFSTKGSAFHPDVAKVAAAAGKAKKLAPDLAIDGEMQGDAAIVPEIGGKKAPGSPVAGRANVLGFPDLDAGNIGYKLVQYLAGATAVGPIIQGLAKPVNDLSRGATVEDIVAVTAITVVQGGAI
jgi:phosphate acetyltransferase